MNGEERCYETDRGQFVVTYPIYMVLIPPEMVPGYEKQHGVVEELAYVRVPEGEGVVLLAFTDIEGVNDCGFFEAWDEDDLALAHIDKIFNEGHLATILDCHQAGLLCPVDVRFDATAERPGWLVKAEQFGESFIDGRPRETWK